MRDLPRRTAIKGLAGAGAALAFGGVGTAAARGRQRQGAAAANTIFDIAEASEDFDILEAALEDTDLDGVLDSGDDQFTVFAPTDEAFGALLEELGISATELLADPDLGDILRYHVTEGRRYASSVVNAPVIEMLNGEEVSVDGTTLNGGQAEIVATDVEASNGVVHVIDGVLLPSDADEDWPRIRPPGGRISTSGNLLLSMSPAISSRDRREGHSLGPIRIHARPQLSTVALPPPDTGGADADLPYTYRSVLVRSTPSASSSNDSASDSGVQPPSLMPARTGSGSE